MKLYELQSPEEVIQLNQLLDKLFYSLGINVEFSRHFADRLLGRERDATIQEVATSFLRLKQKYKKKLLAAKKKPGKYLGILKDFTSDLNIVFEIQNNDMNSITIIRKNPKLFQANVGGGEILKV